MTTPEPSPLSEQELKTLEEYTRSLVCCVCDGPDSDGDHDDDCQAPFWRDVSRAIAQARAARPSPWQPIETAPKDGTTLLLRGGENSGMWIRTGWWAAKFACWSVDAVGGTLGSGPHHWAPLPSPPAQDGGRE